VSPATISRILTRHGAVIPDPSKRPKSSYRRFEAELPNQLWQSDFTHWTLADGSDVEILNWSDDFAGLVDELDLGPVFYVGSSGGARVGLDVVLRHPDRLAGAALAEPPVFSLDPERGKEFLGKVVPAVQPNLDAGDLPGA